CFDGMHHRLPLRRRLSSERIWNDHIARVAALTSPGAEEAAPKARCAVTKNSFVHTAPVLSVAGLAENCASPRRIVAAAPFPLMGSRPFRESNASGRGRVFVDKTVAPTPHPCPQKALLRIVECLVETLPRRGIILTAPHLATRSWNEFDL